MLAAKLLHKIVEREAEIAVIGAGYVGLPLALAFVEAGFRVRLRDNDVDRIRDLNVADSYITHIPSSRIAAALKTERFNVEDASWVISDAAPCEVSIICVPTPITKTRQPDLSCIEAAAANSVLGGLRVGSIVILESTTYPGTTRNVLRPILEGGNLKAGRDFLLAFSPEREDPGNPKYGTSNTPKLVGGIDEASDTVAAVLYGTIVKEIEHRYTLEEAEMAKLLENTFRSVNIALVNEMKTLCNAMEIDVWRVIQAASTKPFGFMPFYPGPGVGGHCIAVDPYYLAYKAKEHGVGAKFIELAGEVNESMPGYIAAEAARALNHIGKAVSKSRVLVVGVAYKANIGDVRESPSLAIMEAMLRHGAQVSYVDEFVPAVRIALVEGGVMRSHDIDHFKRQVEPGTPPEFDCAIIATKHTGFPYGALPWFAATIVDSRHALGIGGVGPLRLPNDCLLFNA